MKTIPLSVDNNPKDASRIFDLTIDPLVRLRTIESGEFEDIACEWATGYLRQFENYKNVAQLGGSKDSGRDIVAYLDQSLQEFDIFQCKRYKDPLTPSVYMTEFGKLCYYTYCGKYNVPRKYFIVASNGVGQDLRELIEHPKTINKRLLDDWDKHCKPKNKITSDGIPLSEELKAYILAFDFSIISEISPPSLLEQFAKTNWYKYYFGGGIKKRPRVSKPIDILDDEEISMEYVNQLMKIYGKHENANIMDVESLKPIKKLFGHFKRQRECFHNARALERFTRDELINDEIYDDLKNQVYHGVATTCEADFVDDLCRVDETVARAQVLVIKTTELDDITILEKSGICHDLVNDGEMSWIYEEKED